MSSHHNQGETGGEGEAEKSDGSKWYKGTPGYRLVLVICIAVSAAGVLYGAFVSGETMDAARGGAVAVSISFATLFLNRSYGPQYFKKMKDFIEVSQQGIADIFGEGASRQKGIEGAGTRRLVSALAKSISIDEAERAKQDWYIAASAIVGTMTSGFGDILVDLLKCLPSP